LFGFEEFFWGSTWLFACVVVCTAKTDKSIASLVSTDSVFTIWLTGWSSRVSQWTRAQEYLQPMEPSGLALDHCLHQPTTAHTYGCSPLRIISMYDDIGPPCQVLYGLTRLRRVCLSDGLLDDAWLGCLQF